MQLLVSVSDAREARDAVTGGADVIDAKNPARGALGPVTLDTLREIQGAVGRARPVSAAVGDAVDEEFLLHLVRDFSASGVRFVKVGFRGRSEVAQVMRLLRAAVEETRQVHPETGVVAVGYADAGALEEHLPVEAVIEAATHVGAAGILVDTVDKSGPGLTGLLALPLVRGWVARAHASGLCAALAGKLRLEDLAFVTASGADIAGVRGAACVGGRMGRVSALRVRELRGVIVEQEETPNRFPDVLRAD